MKILAEKIKNSSETGKNIKNKLGLWIFFFAQHIDLTEKKSMGRNLLFIAREKSSFSFDFRFRFHYFSAFFCGYLWIMETCS